MNIKSNFTEFVGGTTQRLVFAIYDDDGIPLTHMSLRYIRFRISKWNEALCLLEKNYSNNGGVSYDNSTNIIEVKLVEEDTKYLYGLFSGQLILTDTSDRNYIVECGAINIKRMII